MKRSEVVVRETGKARPTQNKWTIGLSIGLYGAICCLALFASPSFAEEEEALDTAHDRLLAAEAAILKEMRAKKSSETQPNSVANALADPAADEESSEGAEIENSRASADFQRIGEETARPSRQALETKPKKAERGFEEKVATQQRSIVGLREKNSGLQSNLRESQEQITKLLKKLEKTESDLFMAETEVERLSRMLNLRGEPGATVRGALPPSTGIQRTRSESSSFENRKTLPYSRPEISKSSADMPIATVLVDKANLRTGPGGNNSPLMTVSKGTRLAVEASKGSWYRIITPTGSRAWVSADVVAFGGDYQKSPSRTVKVESYKEGAEVDAFKLISDQFGEKSE